MPEVNSRHRRLPPWLKRRLPSDRRGESVCRLLSDLKLATVCDGAHCPNRGECYAAGTATFLILGDTCTRACRFCAIPQKNPGPPRSDEPQNVAEAARRLELRYVVITSVTRDDLPDGGAGHFAATVAAVKQRLPETRVEVLTPDFNGDPVSVETVLSAGVDCFNHNVETVPRLYPAVRPQADYRQSLEVLTAAKRIAAERGWSIKTKSGLMVGVGESDDEVDQVIRDLRDAGCDILTVGQYLAPSDAHYPVERFVPPARFDQWRAFAEDLGFLAAACGPFVRSSYHARDVFEGDA